MLIETWRSLRLTEILILISEMLYDLTELYHLLEGIV